jgi:hypothetical protein
VTGKFFTKEEGLAFFSWLLKEWAAQVDLFCKIRTPAR